MNAEQTSSSAEPSSARIARVAAEFEAHRRPSFPRAARAEDVLEVPCELAPNVLRRVARPNRQ
jgi:hypothetical protein